MNESLKVLKIIGDARNIQFNFDEQLIGGAAIDATGNLILF